MIALGIESSVVRGMGHLFRALQYTRYLRASNEDYIVFINKDNASEKILKQYNIRYELVNYDDCVSNWEKRVIEKYKIDIWINDKFETDEMLGRHIYETGIDFYTIDDIGLGEKYAKACFCGILSFSKRDYLCETVYKGLEYIILSEEVEKYRRKRVCAKRIAVTLGGSDTYGVTVDAVKALIKENIIADIFIGPNFGFHRELDEINCGRFRVYQNVSSLIKYLYNYDLAITGGGVTCCEAVASGLPCLVIANEKHEEYTAKALMKMGCCVFLGFRTDWDNRIGNIIEKMNIENMSSIGIQLLDARAVERIFCIIGITGGKNK